MTTPNTNTRHTDLVGYNVDYGAKESRIALAIADAGGAGGGGGGGGGTPADVAAGINASADINDILNELRAINVNTDEIELKLDAGNVSIDNVEVNTQDIEDILNSYEKGTGAANTNTLRITWDTNQFNEITGAHQDSLTIDNLDTLSSATITSPELNFSYMILIVETGTTTQALSTPINIGIRHVQGGNLTTTQQVFNINTRKWEDTINTSNTYYLAPFYGFSVAEANFGAVGAQPIGSSLRIQYFQKDISGFTDDDAVLENIQNALEGNNATTIVDTAFTATQTAQEASPANTNTLELYVQNKSEVVGELAYIRNNGTATTTLSITLGPGGSHTYSGLEAKQALSVLSNVTSLPLYIKRTNA